MSFKTSVYYSLLKSRQSITNPRIRTSISSYPISPLTRGFIASKWLSDDVFSRFNPHGKKQNLLFPPGSINVYASAIHDLAS